MEKLTQLNRRNFIKTSALLSGGLVLSFSFPSCSSKSSSLEIINLNPYLKIGVDNLITIILTKVEMGQGIWTTLPMLIAEELDCDWKLIKVEHSPPGEDYIHTWGGIQGTIGSSSTYSEFDRYRLAGATARTILVEAGAKKLGVKKTACRTENGFVIAGDRKLSYGEVAEDAAKLPVPEVELREAKDWKYIGKSAKRIDGPEKVNGTAKYGIDMLFSDFLTAVLFRAPVIGAKPKSFDATETMKVEGVRDVVQVPSGIAVIGDHFWAAKQGRDALQVEWDFGSIAKISSNQLFKEYRELSVNKGLVVQEKGNILNSLQSDETINYEFILPYLAHAPMEPLNCSVKINGDKCEIWTGTQLPAIDQAAVADVLGIPPENVTITTPFLGGGFGRRGSFTSDWVKEATHVAKASGKSIKLIWTREDDIKGGYYRPASLHNVRVRFGNDGFPTAWQHRIVGQSPFNDYEPLNQDGIGIVGGVKDSAYFDSVPDHSIEVHTTIKDIPVLPWRSVEHSINCFVIESLVDEFAFNAGTDPVDYRIQLLKDHPRQIAVLKFAAEKAKWSQQLPSGQFRGIAINNSQGSIVSQVVELSVDNNQEIHIHRVICAIDCGLAVNPDGIRAQMEGSIVYGLTAALYGEITFENGQVAQSNFHDYKMLRMNEMPKIEVYIVSSSEKMGGAGEPGVPPVAPALANALFAATGKRIYSLPIKLKELIDS